MRCLEEQLPVPSDLISGRAHVAVLNARRQRSSLVMRMTDAPAGTELVFRTILPRAADLRDMNDAADDPADILAMPAGQVVGSIGSTAVRSRDAAEHSASTARLRS